MGANHWREGEDVGAIHNRLRDPSLRLRQRTRGRHAPLIGFSPRKVAHVLYGLKAAKDHEALLAKSGKHSTGKGCVYIKRLSGVDQTVLQTLIVNSVAATRAR